MCMRANVSVFLIQVIYIGESNIEKEDLLEILFSIVLNG